MKNDGQSLTLSLSKTRPLSLFPKGMGVRRVWGLGVFAMAALALMPVLALLGLAFTPSDIPASHLLEHILLPHALRTLLLILGTACGVLFLGTTTAWLASAFHFPCSRLLIYLLPLPFAFPPYLLAYVYAEMLDYAGPLQTALRNLMGWQSPADYFFPDIRSLGGGCFVMSLALYPYVYIAARSVFLKRSPRLIQAAQMLGHSHWSVLSKVALPLARPALIAGCLLALMECLNDVGMAEHFGIRTLTVALYHLWLQRGDLGAAVFIALLMLLFAAALIFLERQSRKARRFHAPITDAEPIPERLSSWKGGLACLFCFLPVFLGFALPLSAVLVMAWGEGIPSLPQLFAPAARSLFLALFGAALIALIALFLGASRRFLHHKAIQSAVSLSTIGYALPGAVLALALAIPISAMGESLTLVFQLTAWQATLPALALSAAVLLLAYMIRFLALPYGLLEAGFARMSPSLDHAAGAVGKSPLQILTRIHLPQLKAPLSAGALLVAIEIMRELPITLFLRPFGFETLAIQIYAHAEAGLLEDAALPTLLLILCGLVLAWLWARRV